MRCSLLVVVVVAVVLPSARALAREGGETASAVSVREAPSDDAPVVRELPAHAPVIAHSHQHGWVRITGAARGWIPNNAFKTASEDTDQEEALLARIAAASETESQARTDADLMYEALKQWRGEPPDAAKIDRLVAQSKKVSERNKRITRDKIKALFWKDPFSEDPRRLIPVRKEDRDLLATGAEKPPARNEVEDAAPRARSSRARSEGSDSDMARLRTALAAARAEVADARAEITRLRAELSRAQAALGDRGDRGGEDRLAEAAPHVRRQASSGHARHLAERSESVANDAPRGQHRRKALGPTVLITAAPAAVTAPPSEQPALPPAGLQSSDPRGIIVVPIEAPAAAPVEAKVGRRAAR